MYLYYHYQAKAVTPKPAIDRISTRMNTYKFRREILHLQYVRIYAWFYVFMFIYIHTCRYAYLCFFQAGSSTMWYVPLIVSSL